MIGNYPTILEYLSTKDTFAMPPIGARILIPRTRRSLSLAMERAVSKSQQTSSPLLSDLIIMPEIKHGLRHLGLVKSERLRPSHILKRRRRNGQRTPTHTWPSERTSRVYTGPDLTRSSETASLTRSSAKRSSTS